MKEKIAAMFPGSGSQYKGMMKKLYDSESCVKEVFDQADDILGSYLSKTITEGSIIKLNKIENLLPGIYISNVAMYRLFQKETNCTPDFFLGHSLGEYSALVSAGILSFEEGLRAVILRSRIAIEIQEKTDGGMTILKDIEPSEVKKICEELRIKEGNTVSIGCYNTKNQVSIVGRDEERQKAEKIIRQLHKNAQIINLIGSAPYHSILMKEKAGELNYLLAGCHFGDISRTVISNVTGMPYQSAENIVEGLTNQIFQPVQWEKSLAYVSVQGASLFLEIGPLNVLKNIFLDSGIAGKVYTYDEIADRASVKKYISEVRAKKPRLYGAIVANCLMHASSLRNYRKDNTGNTDKAKELYQDVVLIKQQSDAGAMTIEEEHARLALKMLVALFEMKDTPVKEQKDRIAQIGACTGEIEFCKALIEVT